MSRHYGCPTCLNFGKVSRVVVVDGKRVVQEPETCPTCGGKGR